MKASKIYLKTYKEVSNTDSVNHNLLTRAAMIYQQGSGLFAYLPLGLKVLHKINAIVRDELNKIDAQEMALSLFSSKQVWDRAKRWDSYGPEMFRIKDRREREYALAPTAEVEFMNMIDKDINSYRNFPLIMYQINEKFRDEIRPRFGLLRARQFIMKDAYSFHSNEESLDKVFNDFRNAYINIFNRLGLNFKICDADTGAIGGKDSLEFIVMTDAGEADVIYCTACDYAANLEKATNYLDADNRNNNTEKNGTKDSVPENVYTPNTQTMDDVSKFLNLHKKDGLKSLVVNMDGKFYLIILRGDRELNEHKLKGHYNVQEFRYATELEIEQLKLVKGFIGPQKSQLKIIADEESVLGFKYGGSNIEHYHTLNLKHGRDWFADHVLDIRMVGKGDKCLKCKHLLSSMKGIEVGHIFKIGDKYSGPMNVNYIDKNGNPQNILFASYGIGISRVLATLVEQFHDDKGIMWPKNVAPFVANILFTNDLKKQQYAESLYKFLKDKGVDVMLDERDLSLGYKMKDSDLIGIPYKIVVGNKFNENKIEVISRSGDMKELDANNLDQIYDLLK